MDEESVCVRERENEMGKGRESTFKTMGGEARNP